MAINSDPIYTQLRQQIIAGRYAPGERLIEERIAQDLGVSRTPVRQALTRIASEGLVELFPNRGAVVRAYSRDDLREAFDLRALLEGFAAYLAAGKITTAQQQRLDLAAYALEDSLQRRFVSRDDEIHFLVEQNQIFHQTIVEASGNRRLAETLAAIVAVPMQYRSFAWYSPEERRTSNFFHRGILNALQRGEAERARAVMQEHIYYGRDALLARLDSEPRPL